MTIRARYKGEIEVVHPGDEENGIQRWERPGGSLPGIPARNLDDDDWQRLSTEDREAVRKSDLYEYVVQARPQQDEPRHEAQPKGDA